jgi:hypothetical protein
MILNANLFAISHQVYFVLDIVFFNLGTTPLTVEIAVSHEVPE